MAHVHIKNNKQAQSQPKKVASSKGTIQSGANHLAKHKIGALNVNTSVH